MDRAIAIALIDIDSDTGCALVCVARSLSIFFNAFLGVHFADASVFILCAISLAALDIEKLVVDGVVIEPVHEYSTGTIRQVKSSFMVDAFGLTTFQSSQAVPMFDKTPRFKRDFFG